LLAEDDARGEPARLGADVLAAGGELKGSRGAVKAVEGVRKGSEGAILAESWYDTADKASDE